jgi:hypothetical protein
MIKVEINDTTYVMDGEALREMAADEGVETSEWVRSALFLVQRFDKGDIRPMYTGLYLDNDEPLKWYIVEGMLAGLEEVIRQVTEEKSK